MRYKYPRTLHLPWSPGRSGDDKVLKSVECFVGKEVVVTEKLDGENTTIYQDYCHARSLDGKHHPSRSPIKNLQSQIGYLLPPNIRVCGENVYAKHSIGYDNLDSPFYVFSVWDREVCLSWDETLEWCEKLGQPSVPVLYRGEFDQDAILKLWNGGSQFGEMGEGYAVRVSDSFSMSEFQTSLAKYVREDHVQTDKHWKATWTPNGMRRD